jgi:hypothetical protein
MQKLYLSLVEQAKRTRDQDTRERLLQRIHYIETEHGDKITKPSSAKRPKKNYATHNPKSSTS